jgi:hypothetical protein
VNDAIGFPLMEGSIIAALVIAGFPIRPLDTAGRTKPYVIAGVRKADIDKLKETR